MSVLALIDNINTDFALLGYHFRGGALDNFFELLGADFPSGHQVIGF